ncbi:MAG: tryptophan--tRNA ligase [Elusimicrobia bacterium]|nr:tryptophan--tRNA ligase [Elusimicrobiota bacterium]
MKKEIILSGMRPTGKLHLGNYFGALRNWVSLQDEYECFFEVADWHALMSDYAEPGKVRENSFDMVCVWLACGIDPKKSVIFRQSDVPEHLELYFILSTLTPIAWLERCPTYKEALANIEGNKIRNFSFLGYPALQAADIALYRADKVPVGVDQLPHLEFTREVVRRFNSYYDTEVMVEPDALLTDVLKLPGTDSRKMSKSYNNTIHITEDKETLEKKVLSMVTDPARIRVSDKGHPEVCSVFAYHNIFSSEATARISDECKAAQRGCVDCKRELIENMESSLGEFRDKYLYYTENPDKVNNILDDGNRRASERAKKNMRLFRDKMKYYG